MTIDRDPVSRAAGSAPAQRAIIQATETAAHVLITGDPASVTEDRTLLAALSHARAAAASGEDGTDGRAAAVIGVASAHVAAGSAEEAFLAIDQVRSLFPR
ncbi:hypothetical protein GCM10023201_59620 [Actinomycetospora corticicola]|uniref:Uncharacterized protein n=1 Tax=Actinomycetospora corticicola TaxID=663602 RepID=A0A7Y9E1U2_9PSEU|nr:hypothetical protein [Actinomycetospora corticicola]NYD39673.1 hypothetical protein [Actinomycetospora corticicola]